jgi:Na+-translocating ferredoxin:NAD+ oxidoreductase RnfC subunit
MFERRAGFEVSIMELQALLDAVEAAGVVGAGGGGFPTAVKLKAEADTIIINGAECEPLLNADHLLMVHHADMLTQTLAVLVKLTGACQGIVALKGKHKDRRPRTRCRVMLEAELPYRRYYTRLPS